MDWHDGEIIETIPGKVSGAPLLVGTRIPVSAITENYGAFLEDGLSPQEALDETLDCYPSAGVQNIKTMIACYYSHQPQR